MKVELYGKTYYAKKDKITHHIFLYANLFYYVIDIPSMELSIMYEMHNQTES